MSKKINFKMRKILLFPLFALLCFVTSCSLDTKGNSAEVTTFHFGNIDSIAYSNPDNSNYNKYISDALKKDSIVNVLYEHKAKVNTSDMSYAIWICDKNAYDEYPNYLNRINLDDIKRNIFTASYPKDSVFQSIIKDCGKYTDLSLQPFKMYISLYNYTGGYWIRKDTIDVK